MHTCNFVFDNGRKCISTYMLHSMYFRDPYNEYIPVFVSLCHSHYSMITEEYNERVREFQMKIANLIAENANRAKTARNYGSYYDGQPIKQKIDDLKIVLKRIQTKECRNYFCMADLTKLAKDQKLFSAHTFRPNGLRHLSLYFCSLKCQTIMKCKCGITSLIQQEQTSF